MTLLTFLPVEPRAAQVGGESVAGLSSSALGSRQLEAVRDEPDAVAGVDGVSARERRRQTAVGSARSRYLGWRKLSVADFRFCAERRRTTPCGRIRLSVVSYPEGDTGPKGRSSYP
jgi:hypothetical protein